jgi:hypothetical protein
MVAATASTAARDFHDLNKKVSLSPFAPTGLPIADAYTAPLCVATSGHTVRARSTGVTQHRRESRTRQIAGSGVIWRAPIGSYAPLQATHDGWGKRA